MRNAIAPHRWIVDAGINGKMLVAGAIMYLIDSVEPQ